MAGIKKIVRPMNKAKNDFIKWLEKNNATSIDDFEGEKTKGDGWDYYRSISAFVGESLYVVCFTVWRGEESIDYRDGEYKHPNLSIEEFNDLIN